MVAFCTGLDPIDIGDLGSNIKVTVTENVCKKNEKNRQKLNLDIFFFNSDLIIR